MIEQNIKVKVNVENNVVIDKTEEKKLCKILVAKGDKGQDGTVSFDELTEEQKASLKGEDGKGIPEGGTAGQILAKTSDNDFDAEWIDNNAEIDLTDYAKKNELPTKMSELENDVYYVKSNDPSVKFDGRVHIYNGKTDGDGRKVDLLVEHIQGGGYGGYEADLHINYRNPLDVHILQGGEGKLYYKDKEVATQEYVDEKISNVEVGDIDLTEYAKKNELPTKMSELENDSGYVTNTDYASSDNVGLVKTERHYGLHTSSKNGTLYCEQLSYDEYTNDKDDNCFVGKGTLENVLEAKDYASKGYVDEQISNIEASGGTGGSDYELPIASAGTLGGIKVGMNLSIDADGTLNAVGGGTGEGSVVNGEVLPIGTMIPYGSANNVPANWRICDGSEVSRTAYADLFNVIGTAYGEGDGETTFNLPNKKGRVSVGLDLDQEEFNEVGLKDGEKQHTLTVNEMPSHTHSITAYQGDTVWKQGLPWARASNESHMGVTEWYGSYTGGNQAHNNLQPYEVDVWIIKVSNVVGGLENVNANVIDNLTSTSTTDVLSANMGRELKEKIENLNIDTDYSQEYSTEEKVIGTWIDGKPIYRKVVQTTTPATANVWTDIDTGIENIETHISKNISYKVNNLTYFADAYENSTYRFLAVPNGNKVSVLVGISGWCSKPMTMVLEYTKTTD